MTARDDLDRHLAAWLTADAPTREPEHLLGEVLARTARTRRRPAWRILERWIPMSVASSRVATSPRVPWRTVGLVALLVIALIAVGAVYIGSRQHRVPSPFGPAANGQIVFSSNGDILAVDAPSGIPRTIVGGATTDGGPLFSPDGTRFAFVRGDMASADAELWVADADGANARKLAATPRIGWVEWSPQGDEVALSLDGILPVIRLVRTDGSGSTDIDTGLAVAENPIWRPADGQQITFRGQDRDGTWGIYSVGRNGADLRRLELDPGFETDAYYDANRDAYFQGPTWSADGKHLLYYTLEPDPASTAGPGFRIHVADISADGSVMADRIRTFDATSDDEMTPALLPDGETLVYQQTEGTQNSLMTGKLSGTADPLPLGLGAEDYWIPMILSPDGTQLMSWLPPSGGGPVETWSTDLASGRSTKVALWADDFNWQRLAR